MNFVKTLIPVLTKNLLEDEPKCGLFNVIIVSNLSLNFFKCVKLDLIINPPKECPIREIFTLPFNP